MKHIAKHSFHARYLSHPVRVRGLKRTWYSLLAIRQDVAPRAGAWVETRATILTLTLTGGRTPCGCVG